MSAANVGDLINETRAMLMGGYRPGLNWLSNSQTAGDTTFIFTDELFDLTRGAYISIDDELMYVRSTVKDSRTATVKRAMLGTTAAAHAADSEVEVNPRFASPLIRREMQKEIRSWPNRLYQVSTIALALSNDVRGYDLAGTDDTLLGVIRVEVEPDKIVGIGSSKAWIRPRFRLIRKANLTDFPSGNGIIFDAQLGDLAGSRRVHVILAKPFTTSTFTNATTVSTIGLADSQLDIPVIGSSWRLMASREVQRSFVEAQGQSRDAAEVPPRTALLSSELLKSQRNARIGEEIERLYDRYPILET